MIRLGQKIGIFYDDLGWGRECFEHIVNQIPVEYIKKKVIKSDGCFCELYTGDIIRTIRAAECSRGFKVTAAIVQDTVDYEMINLIVRPSVLYPIFSIKDVGEVVANYTSIKQELPRRKKGKKIKVTIKY